MATGWKEDLADDLADGVRTLNREIIDLQADGAHHSRIIERNRAANLMMEAAGVLRGVARLDRAATREGDAG